VTMFTDPGTIFIDSGNAKGIWKNEFLRLEALHATYRTLIITYPISALQLGIHLSSNLNLAQERQSVVSWPQQPSVEHCELQTCPLARHFSSDWLFWICSSAFEGRIFFQLTDEA
jgi:hypothetical protein